MSLLFFEQLPKFPVRQLVSAWIVGGCHAGMDGRWFS
jgi:hypothetical protein